MDNNKYNPGLHILAELKTTNIDKLIQLNLWQQFIDNIIRTANLCQVGEAQYSFNNNGFTAIYCLTESHIAIHTWPEFGILTYDIFLCNYSKDNTILVEEISHQITNYFEGEIIQINRIKR